MEQTTLKYLRVLIPGFIVLIGLLPLRGNLINEANNLTNLDYNYLVLFSLIIGAIYYQLNIQHIITRPSYYFIVRNIYNKIIALHSSLTQDAKEKIWEEKIYMDVFYDITDNDQSLTRKGLNVKFNGIFWTTSADLSIISLIYWMLYKFNILTINDSRDVILRAFLIIFILSLFLHIISVMKHIKLGNEQLKTIRNRFRTEVVTKIDRILASIN